MQYFIVMQTRKCLSSWIKWSDNGLGKLTNRGFNCKGWALRLLTELDFKILFIMLVHMVPYLKV